MTAPTCNVDVWAGPDFAWVRLVGRANCAASVNFKRLVQRLKEQGLRRIVLDVSECQLMDSTFLGVLAGLATRSAPDTVLELFRPSPRVQELIDNLGVADLFRINPGEPPSLEGCTTLEVAPTAVSKRDVSTLSLEAHRELMRLNPSNVPKFRDVTEFLAEDLQRLNGTGSSPA